jgi:hypothetical protein
MTGSEGDLGTADRRLQARAFLVLLVRSVEKQTERVMPLKEGAYMVSSAHAEKDSRKTSRGSNDATMSTWPEVAPFP